MRRLVSFWIFTTLALASCKSSDDPGSDGGTPVSPDGVGAGGAAGTPGLGGGLAGSMAGSGGSTAGAADGALGGNGGTGDSPGADAAVPDAAVPDAAVPDAAVPDAAVPDAAVPDVSPADANPHGGASLWIPFNKPGTTSTYYFDRCTWFTVTDGYCVLLKNQTSTAGTKTSDLFQTNDGGLTFSQVATIDGGNTALDGDMDIYVLSPTEIWYTTAFVGMGYSGTIGRSTDGGKSFQSLTTAVQKALADPDATPVPDYPLWRLVKVDGRVWVGSYSNYLALSPDGGTTWQRVAGPAEMSQASAPELIATQGDLFLLYERSFLIELYRWNGSAFAKVEASFPAPSGRDHGSTWWRSSPFGNGVVFVDQRQYSWWGWPFAVSATIDGGKSFQTILSGQSQSTSDVAGLRDALVVNGSLAYIGGVFLGDDKKEYSQIRKSSDGGHTWTVVHSEPSGDSYTSVVLDPSGRAHAMRHVTDYYMNEYSYTGHYVLP